MLFNTTTFLQFFLAFLFGYYLCRNKLAARNALIVASSYLFYGWWDYRFLVLLFFSTLLDYIAARRIETTTHPRARTLWLLASITGNLGILGFFKYWNFFAESTAALCSSVGWTLHPFTLNIILPVGISFYTFQTMSYTIDVYRRRITAETNLITFASFVSFFPQLVAGPIERATSLLPQFRETRTITQADIETGIWLMAWGLFKKVVVADNLAPLVDQIFSGTPAGGAVVTLGTLAFAMQIYGDFSGYSDIARGLARLLGFHLMVNFRTPYFAADLRDFWSRWHISLSTWLRDYLYIPLGGSRAGPARTATNLMITMTLGGLWHGAAVPFLLWGLWHGVALGWQRSFARLGFRVPWLIRFIATQLVVQYGWLLFRSGDWTTLVVMHTSFFSSALPIWWSSAVAHLAVLSAPVFAMDLWMTRTGRFDTPPFISPWLRGGVTGLLVIAVWVFWEKQTSAFLYFQF